MPPQRGTTGGGGLFFLLPTWVFFKVPGIFDPQPNHFLFLERLKKPPTGDVCIAFYRELQHADGLAPEGVRS